MSTIPADVWSIVIAFNPYSHVARTCKELHALQVLMTCRGCQRIDGAPLCSCCGCRRHSTFENMIQSAAYTFNSAGMDRHCRKELLQAMKKGKIDAIYVTDVEKKMKKTSRAFKRFKKFANSA